MEMTKQYPDRFDKEHKVSKIREMEIGSENLTTAGRVLQVRRFGRLTFADLQDDTAKIQISFRENVL